MKKSTMLKGIFTAALTLLATGQGLAQNFEEIKERARFLEEYRSMIHPEADKTLRLAAIEEGLKSDDDLIQREAFDATLGSDDSDLIYLGLRHFIKQRSQFMMELTLPKEASDGQKTVYEKYNQKTFSNLDILENGEISFLNGYKGAFIDKGFVLNWGTCNLKITSVSKDMLSGNYTCRATSSLSAKILID